MCLVFCAYGGVSEQRLLLIANRDEYYARPTMPLHRWPGAVGVCAGKDLEGGGTWLGVNALGRMALLTNYRAPRLAAPTGAASRGAIALSYLHDTLSALDFLQRLRTSPVYYAGFSLLLMDEQGLYYYHSPTREIHVLPKGIYGLSNARLNTPWPKLRKGCQAFAAQLERNVKNETAFFEIMADSTPAPDYLLPSTGLPYAKEKAYSARFIRTAHYGTRSTTFLSITQDLKVQISEKTYAVGQQKAALQQETFQATENVYA